MQNRTVFGALQVASKVSMIPACGMLLLCMSSRLSRAIHRVRSLSGESAAKRRLQVENLSTRARQIRAAFLAVSLAMFFATVLALAPFLSIFMDVDLELLVSALFVASLLCLIVSLVCLMADMTGSLRAMDAE